MAGQVKHAKIFSVDRAGLAAGETAGHSALEEHRRPDRRSGQGAGRRGHPPVRFHALLKPLLATAGAMTRRKPDEGRDSRYRLRPPRSRRAGGLRRGPERGHLRARLRGAGGHGRHRRHAAPRGRAGERPPPVAGESGAPPRASAVRRPRGGAGHHPGDAAKPATTVLAVEAGRTLMLDREEMLRSQAERRPGIMIAVWNR